MKICLFRAKKDDRKYFNQSNDHYGSKPEYFDIHLDKKTALLARGSDTICAFVNDEFSQSVLEVFAEHNIKLLLMRCAGFNNVDLEVVNSLEITVVHNKRHCPDEHQS